MNNIKVAVGTVTYNNSNQQLERFAESLKVALTEAHKYFQGLVSNLYIKDNGKHSGFKKFSASAIILPPTGNNGYSKSMNVLIAKAFNEAKCDYFISANPDGIFHPECIIALLNAAKDHPADLIEAMQFPMEHPKVYDPKTNITPWGSGCCLMLPRTLYEEVGMLDDNFFMYMEDVDYSWRVRSLKRYVRTCQTAKFFHPTTNIGNSRLKMKFYYESGRYLAHKWDNKIFREWCESQLLELGYYNNKRALPSLPQPPKVSVKKDIVNFSYKFHFSESRW